LPLLTLTHARRGIGALVARALASVRLLLLDVEVLATLVEVFCMIADSTSHLQVWAMQLVEPVMGMAAWDVGQHTLHQGAHTRVVLI